MLLCTTNKWCEWSRNGTHETTHPSVQTDNTHNKESGPPSLSPSLPSRWRNEPHALSHPFPSCSAPACSSTEPPCCRSESLGCQRETGAKIRDHPPSPPVSIAAFPVAAVRGVISSLLRAVLSSRRLWKGLTTDISWGWSGCFSFLPPSSRCVGLPLQTALGPLLASASREPVRLQGRQRGTDPRVFMKSKMET